MRSIAVFNTELDSQRFKNLQQAFKYAHDMISEYAFWYIKKYNKIPDSQFVFRARYKYFQNYQHTWPYQLRYQLIEYVLKRYHKKIREYAYSWLSNQIPIANLYIKYEWTDTHKFYFIIPGVYNIHLNNVSKRKINLIYIDSHDSVIIT